MTDHTPTQPTLTLNNGVHMPALGLGVYQSSPEDTTDAVLAALENGYRHVDTAAAYFNEEQVGRAIARSGLDRSEIFIETKLWISDYGYDNALRGFDKSARKLGVEQVDLLLLHQPLAEDFAQTIAAYRALETLLADGRVRAIGVSNQTPAELDRLVAETQVVPAVNPTTRSPNGVPATTGTASSPSAGHPSVVPTTTATPTRTRSRTPSWSRSARSTARPAPRSCCAGTSTTAGPPFRSPSSRTASRRTSTSSTSPSRPTRSPPSTPSTLASGADRTPTA